MSATEVIKGILKDKNVTQVELAERTNVTKQNLSNKMNRDNFSTLELVEIADALEMQLLLKNTSDGKEYIIDYSNNTIAVKAGMTYDKEGKPVSSYSYKDFELVYQAIAPSSNAELWAELIKKPRLLNKTYKWQQSQQ